MAVARHDLPREKFPFTLVAWLPDGQIVWMVTVLAPESNDRPGRLYVPPLRKQYGQPVEIKACDPTELALALDGKDVWDV